MATPVAVQVDPDELARALRTVELANGLVVTQDALRILLKALSTT